MRPKGPVPKRRSEEHDHRTHHDVNDVSRSDGPSPRDPCNAKCNHRQKEMGRVLPTINDIQRTDNPSQSCPDNHVPEREDAQKAVESSDQVRSRRRRRTRGDPKHHANRHDLIWNADHVRMEVRKKKGPEGELIDGVIRNHPRGTPEVKAFKRTTPQKDRWHARNKCRQTRDWHTAGTTCRSG